MRTPAPRASPTAPPSIAPRKRSAHDSCGGRASVIAISPSWSPGRVAPSPGRIGVQHHHAHIASCLADNG
ncbi:hypothetical protein, partial [Saccharopolyspora sp. NPDC002686]|uniref:hypothetical protein n=1 Tax=Saccharopolyspora sp. NPDC002686 TaxID=3154541 RepID=UPI00331ECDB7